MDNGVQNSAYSVKAEFAEVIKDLSQYLLQQKESGNTFLKISKESQSLINNLGEICNNNPEIENQPAHPFFFEGSQNSDIFIIDSGVDFFKGESGELLIKILSAMKLKTSSVFICNAGDLKFVKEKIKNIAPKIIITLGSKASQLLTKSRQPLKEIQGKFYNYKGINVMPTFHPSLLLKHPEYKRQVWEDMKKVMKYTGNQYGV